MERSGNFIGPLCPGRVYLLWSLGACFTFRVSDDGEDWHLPLEAIEPNGGVFVPGYKIIRQCPAGEPIAMY